MKRKETNSGQFLLKRSLLKDRVVYRTSQSVIQASPVTMSKMIPWSLFHKETPYAGLTGTITPGHWPLSYLLETGHSSSCCRHLREDGFLLLCHELLSNSCPGACSKGQSLMDTSVPSLRGRLGRPSRQ